MLANLAQPLMSAVDTGIAGHLPGEAALGGVALGGLIFNFVFWSFGFLRMTTTGFVAQALGAGDTQAEAVVSLRAFLLAAAIGLVIICVQGPLIALALRLLGGSDAVRVAAGSYAHARIWSAPATLGNYVILGVLFGRQLPGLALALQLFVNVLNAVAAAVIVYGLHRGVAGLGAATAAADWIAFGVGLALLGRPRGINWVHVLDRRELLRALAVNRDVFLRTLCLIGGFGWFTHEGAALGDTVLAANALLLNFQTFMASALDGFAMAAETLAGAAIGAGDRPAFRAVLRQASICAAALAVAIGLFYAVAGVPLVELLTNQPGIRAVAEGMLVWICVSPLVSVWCFMLDGVFIGATRGRELRDGAVLSLAAFVAVTWLVPRSLGDHGLWLGFLMFMGLRAVFLAIWLPRIDFRAAPIIAAAAT